MRAGPLRVVGVDVNHVEITHDVRGVARRHPHDVQVSHHFSSNSMANEAFVVVFEVETGPPRGIGVVLGLGTVILAP